MNDVTGASAERCLAIKKKIVFDFFDARFSANHKR